MSEATVKHLLSQRTGMLMQREHSKLTKLQLNADAVVDGFEVEQEAVVNKGTLSTSIVGKTTDKDAVVANQHNRLALQLAGLWQRKRFEGGECDR